MERDEQRSRNYGVDHKLHGMPHGRSEIRILQRLLPNTQMRTRKRLRHLRRLQRIGQLHHSRSYFPALSRRKRKSQGLTPVLFTETGTPPDKKNNRHVRASCRRQCSGAEKQTDSLTQPLSHPSKNTSAPRRNIVSPYILPGKKQRQKQRTQKTFARTKKII